MLLAKMKTTTDRNLNLNLNFLLLCLDWQQFILCLFIFYEMTKGISGYWYPYLRMMPDVYFTAFWSQDDIEMFQDPDIKLTLQIYKAELKELWISFAEVIK